MALDFSSTVISRGPTWKGFGALRFLIIFGASYCDVGYEYSISPIPSYDQPLGVEFPGATYAEPNAPNWVGHLIKTYAPGNKFLVYNYAKGGSQVYNVKNQIQVMFQRQLSSKPASAPWTAEDTLFITWVGINDAAWGSEHEENLQKLFEAQETLFESGARNFLFVNVPPINRAPVKGHELNYINWNIELTKAATLFATTHRDATIMIYSSWDTFTALLDDPTAHGFPAEDACKAHASVWVDHLHPTSQVHDFIARDVFSFLTAQPDFDG